MVEKQFYVDVGVYASALIAITTVANSGILSALNVYVIQGFTITQVIWMSLIMIAGGVLVTNWLMGYITLSDVQRQETAFLEKVGGKTAAETRAITKQTGNSLKNQITAAFKRPSKTNTEKKVNAIAEESVRSELPSPELLWQRVQERLQAVIHVNAIQLNSSLASPTSTGILESPLPVLIGMPAPTTDLQTSQQYSKKKIIVLIILVVIAIIVQFLPTILPAFSI